MRTEDIQKQIKDFKHNLVPTITDQALLSICEALNAYCRELETRLDAVEGTARHANNIASCLANGIQPD